MIRRTATEVAITGLGMLTPAGIGVTENWQRVCQGGSTAAAIDPELAGLPVPMGCRVPGFDAEAMLGRRTAWRLDRVSQLTLAAAREALEDAKLDPTSWDGARVGVVLGNALGGTNAYEQAYAAMHESGPAEVSPLVMVQWPINMISGYLAMQCGALGPNMVIATACASGVTAIGVARQLLQAGLCDVVITGGAEAPLSRTPMAAYSQMGALSRRIDDPAGSSRPFDADRDGFVAAEAAAILILERADSARSRGAHIRALVTGFGSSADGHHASAPDPSGAGVIRAIHQALGDAGLEATDIDHVNAHGTSTMLNDVIEAGVIARVYASPAVTSTKGVTGHALGAAGAVETIYTALSVEYGLIPPTANLVRPDPRVDVDVVRDEPRRGPVAAAVNHSLGFGGQNAVLVLTTA